MNRYRVSFDTQTKLYVETIVPHGRYCLAEDAMDQIAALQLENKLQRENLDDAATGISILQARIAELEAQSRWKPVEDGYSHLCHCIDCANGEPDGWGWVLHVNGDGIGIEDPDNPDDDRWVLLPDDKRLCRLTNPGSIAAERSEATPKADSC